jgi:cytochrome c peroxidase
VARSAAVPHHLPARAPALWPRDLHDGSGLCDDHGRCADVGKITLQSMRGLAARAPYFSNGLAKDLRGIVDYYDRRYSIGYTEQEKQDLVNMMSVL